MYNPGGYSDTGTKAEDCTINIICEGYKYIDIGSITQSKSLSKTVSVVVYYKNGASKSIYNSTVNNTTLASDVHLELGADADYLAFSVISNGNHQYSNSVTINNIHIYND